MEFLDKLAFDEELKPLYKTKAVQDIVENLWGISKSYFTWYFFMTFFCLNIMTLIVGVILVTKI